MKIIFATGNKGKINEIKMILADLKCEVISMKDAGINIDIIEDGKTFEENSLIKANAVMHEAKEMGMNDVIVLADDSGLEVDYLGKAPGIYSARYLGENTSYKIKNYHIINLLDGVEKEKRTARFVCTIACALPDGKNYVTRGTIEGFIGYEEEGENGFGYDPIFRVDEYGCSTASLSPEKKNEISHRGKALRKMKEILENENIGC